MANGNHALHLAPEPAPIETTASKPDAGVEGLVGDVLAGLADVSVQAFQEVQTDRLSKATRAQGGELIALLHQARQALGAVEFVDTMHRQSHVLRRRHGVELSQAAVSEITDELIAVVVRVDATLQAMAQTTNQLQ